MQARLSQRVRQTCCVCGVSVIGTCTQISRRHGNVTRVPATDLCALRVGPACAAVRKRFADGPLAEHLFGLDRALALPW